MRKPLNYCGSIDKEVFVKVAFVAWLRNIGYFWKTCPPHSLYWWKQRDATMSQ